MQQLSLFNKAAIAGVLLALPTTWLVSRAWGFNPQPDPPGISGLVGIVDGQTARLNALNSSRVPINVVLNFFDADGNVLKRSAIITVLPGHAASLDLTPTRTDSGGGRYEVYGDVVLLPAVRSALPPDPYVPTLEVIDAAGRTALVIDGFHNPPSDHNPPGDKPSEN